MLISTEAAAEHLGLSRRTLEKWRWLGGGPVFRKLGRAVRYDVADLDAFVEQGKRSSTSAEPEMGV